MNNGHPDFMIAARSVRQPHIDFLRAAGVTGHATIKAGMYGVSPIVIRGTAFEFADDGKEAFIQPVYFGDAPAWGSHGLIDLVAWFPRRPDRFWTHSGDAWAMGEHLAEPWWLEEPIQIWRRPLDWLRAGGSGLCVLEWETARYHLRDFTLISEGFRHGIQLEKLLTIPAGIPNIVLQQEGAR